MLEELSKKFDFFSLPRIEEVLEILDKNTNGKVWMLGGGIFRQLVNKQWNSSLPYRDLDFVAEETVIEVYCPKGWECKSNSYGSYKLMRDGLEIDLWSVEQQHSITSRNLAFSIEKVLEFSPLNVQSIAYDLDDDRVLGNNGLQAILDKKVAVNNQQQIEYYCGLKGITVRTFIEQKAKVLGFTPVYP